MRERVDRAVRRETGEGQRIVIAMFPNPSSRAVQLGGTRQVALDRRISCLVQVWVTSA